MSDHGPVSKVVVATVVLLLLTCAPSTRPQSASPLFFTSDEDGFTATGSWIPADSKTSSSVRSETEIDCFKNSLSCVEATAEFYSDHPHVTLNYLQVLKWDNDGIIASDASGICMTVAVQISFAEKRISSTHSAKQLDDKKKEACKFFRAEKTEEDIFILKGSERWTKEHALIIPKKSAK
jgi:hypothetical protein